ncbi:glycosyltransferase family 4 protein [Planctomycetota bacterium]
MESKLPKKLAVITTVDATMAGLVLAQIKAAQREGFSVYGLCAKGPYYKMLEDNEIFMRSLPFVRSITPLKDLIALWKLYRFFKHEQIDIVHTHTPKAALYGLLASKIAGVKLSVNTAHGLSFNENTKSLLRFCCLAYEHFAARLVDITLMQNPEDVETAKNLKIGRPEKIRYLGNGVDLQKFNPSKFDSDFVKAKKAELKIPQDALVIGIIGRIVREKGFLELFEAMKKLMPRYKKVWLVIIGPEQSGRNGGISGNTFKEFGIEDRTCWLGRRDDVAELLACFNIYAFPSWREGFPRSAIEAAAMGLPIVTTNIRGCRQVVEDGVNGILVPLRNVNALEAALTKIIEDENLRNEMGKKGYEKAQSDFDEKKVCKIVIDTYEELLSEKINRS